MLSRAVRNRDYSGVRRFSNPNPDKMDRKFWQAHLSDTPPAPPAGEKYTLDEAREKLKTDGHVVMKQKAFDDIVNEKYGKGYNKGKNEAEGELSEEQKLWKKSHTEAETLRKKLADLEKDKPDTISRSEHEALLKVEQEKIKQSEEKIGSLRTAQKDNEILKIIGAKTVDSESVLALTRDKFAIDDDGKVYPINEKGDRLIGSSGHVDIAGFFEGFFKEKPYLAKASDSQGAGSQSTGSGGNTTTSGGKYTLDQLADMSDADFAKVGGMQTLSQ